jgi:dTDP-4-amino-4,6-dideoxygalactose transaminase
LQANLSVSSFFPLALFEADEIASATEPLASGKVNYWTGQEGREFEKEYAAFTGCRHAIALANGTVALELALYALGIGPGDEVITTSRTFMASASCVVMRGATPVMADVDPVSQNVSAETIRPSSLRKPGQLSLCTWLVGLAIWTAFWL